MAKQVSVSEAAGLMKAGWRYLDVRSIPEFEAGHPAGAANVPLLHNQGGRFVPNPDFHAVMAANFAPGDQLLVGCKTAGRSAQAAAQLEASGFTNVALVRGGYVGERDPFGRIEAPGWLGSGLPVAQQAAPGCSYAELATKINAATNAPFNSA
jgi:rhodanese-related sulfurtransferase